MAYIFLDESGDLGFDFSKKKTSKYFLISFLFVKSKNNTEKIIKKIIATQTSKERKRNSGILHATKEHPRTRMKVLNALKEKDISIIIIYLNKSKVYSRLQDEKHVLYNYVTNILLDRILTKKLIPLEGKIHLIASQRETNKFLNQNFKNYLTDQSIRNHKINIEIEIKNPSSEKCLQLVDFVSWSAFRKHEHRDDTYYNIIKDKIIEDRGLFA